MKDKKILDNPILTQNYTRVEASDVCFNAPHLFEVVRAEDGKVLCTVPFQRGPIKENGVNGVANEDLIAMVLERLSSFQASDWKCKENEMAITKLEEALMWLRSRTNKRVAKGVEGTSNK